MAGCWDINVKPYSLWGRRVVPVDTILQCVADDASYKTASFSFTVDMELPKTEYRFAVINDGSVPVDAGSEGGYANFERSGMALSGGSGSGDDDDGVVAGTHDMYSVAIGSRFTVQGLFSLVVCDGGGERGMVRCAGGVE
jgi:hypothetical protein